MCCGIEILLMNGFSCTVPITPRYNSQAPAGVCIMWEMLMKRAPGYDLLSTRIEKRPLSSHCSI